MARNTTNFDDWWFQLENMHKAEKRFSKEAERICNEKDPNLKIDNLYTDTLETLAKESKMHLE